MAVPVPANYVFLPWVRQGAASGIQTPDSLSANQAGVVSVPVKLRVNTDDLPEQQVRLYGPGDVTGIDPQQVIRTEPRHLAMEFEPNYFPAIEFDRPDFPWLFTPAKADAAGKLRPWLCLVVVRKQAGVVILRVDRNLPLPVLEIEAPERELPDLSESWAWAHAQVTGSKRDSLPKALAGDPALTMSRLLCPRRLDPATEYLACVVPTFALGRKAGLGLPIDKVDEQKLEPAWTSGVPVTLPVYFHWEFRTGTGGDFEALVGLLKPRQLPKAAGKREMDISNPGFITLPPDEAELEGALRVADAPTAEWPVVTRMPFQDKLKNILNVPWQAMKDENEEPLLGPPIYGCWQAARHTVEIPPPASKPWLDELNLDPRHRAVAALGTKVVQTQQEQLMAAAWEQFGEIQQINQIRRQAQLGRAVNAVYHARHFNRFSDETLLKVVASAQSRLVVETAGSGSEKTRAMLSHRISQSAMPDRAVSTPVRRLTNPRGAISARFQPAEKLSIAIISRLNASTSVVPAQRKPGGWVTIDRVSGQMGGEIQPIVRFDRIANSLADPPKISDFEVISEGVVRSLFLFEPGPPKFSDTLDFLNAARSLHDYLDRKVFKTEDGVALPALANPGGQEKRLRAEMDLAKTKEALLQSINPEKTIHARVNASLKLAGNAEQAADPLEPLMDAPEFPHPMYEALRDLSQDFLFPGLEHVPPNTVTLLETNPKFVESFLVGLNAEMSHELLWRGYPTDQRGTYFRQFWDARGRIPPATPEPGCEECKDIPRINLWHKPLGENLCGLKKDSQLVLLIRGELLRRYPNSVIYAVEAAEGRLDLSQKEKHPIFRGTLKPDVTFLGFDLTQQEAFGEPGWFFVIQEQPTEPRFGLDADSNKSRAELKTWHDLSWRHLANTEAELKVLSHASIKTVLPEIDKAKWGKNSSHQAYITLQRPVRIAIHAKELIPQEQF